MFENPRMLLLGAYTFKFLLRNSKQMQAKGGKTEF